MKGHVALMALLSVMISLVFAFIAKHGARERLRYFLYLTACFLVLSLLAAWLMFPFPL